MTRRCNLGRIVISSLLVGLLSAGVFISCDKSSAPTGPMNQSSTGIRSQTGSGAAQEGGASLATDKGDYAPGETVTLTGGGFAAGENVTMRIAHADGNTPVGNGHGPWTATADENGGFVTTWVVCGDDCLGATLIANADGELSGLHAEATFTDKEQVGTGRVVSVVPTGDGCVHQTINNANAVEHWDVQEGQTYVVTLDGVTECLDYTIGILVKSSDTGNQCLTATRIGEGKYEFEVTIPSPACNTMPIIYCVNNCSASSGEFARQSDGDSKQAHLRVWNFGPNCDQASGSPDTDCNGGGGCTINITCPADLQVVCRSDVPTPDFTGGLVEVTGNCNYELSSSDVEVPGDCPNHYIVSRTWTATIAATGQSASCTQTIRVYDNVAPTIACPADIFWQVRPGDVCPPILQWQCPTGTDNCGGAVTVTCVPPAGSPFPIGTTPVTVTAVDECGNTASCTFNVTVFSSACGIKFYDANVNGLNDDGIFVPNWGINLTGPVSYAGTTGPDGRVCFFGLPTGTYTLSETMQGGWIATTPTSATFDLGCPREAAFGNVCLGGGGGKTIGYWSNKNGKATMMDGGTAEPELAMLRSLCLVNADGSNFDPTTVAQYQSWILSANAVNMAFMLSAQLSAMELNVESGFVKGTALVYMPGCGNTGVGNNFISINDLMVAAAAALCADGYTPDGDPNRATQECLKNALDRANNNLNFVQPGPCTSTTTTTIQKQYTIYGN